MVVSARRIQRTLLMLVVLVGIGVLGGWAASRFGLDALNVRVAFAEAAGLILILVPVRISAVVSEVFPGPADPLFQLAIDPKLSLQATGNPDRRSLLRQSGEAGQPGSTWVTKVHGQVLTTTVVSSDPPRKLVTSITGRFRLVRMDVTRTYVTEPGGTLLEMRSRQRMPLFAWLLRPVFKRELEAQVAQVNARIKEYLASDAANTSGVGN